MSWYITIRCQDCRDYDVMGPYLSREYAESVAEDLQDPFDVIVVYFLEDEEDRPR